MKEIDKVIHILQEAQNALLTHQISLLDHGTDTPLARLYEIHEANTVYDKLSELIAKVHESR